MTVSDPGSQQPVTGEERSDADVDAAELEAIEDEAARERQKTRSAVVGAIALVVMFVLTAVGIVTAVTRSADPPPAPGFVQQAPSPPAAP